MYDKEQDLDRLVRKLDSDAIVFVRGRFYKVSKDANNDVVVEDKYWTPRQLVIYEETLKWDNVCLTGALGSGKTLIAMSKIVWMLERDPVGTLVCFWVVTSRKGDDINLALFKKVRTAVISSVSKKVSSQVNVDDVLDCRFVGTEYSNVRL